MEPLQSSTSTFIKVQFQSGVLTGGGGASWSWALWRAPSFHIEGTRSYKVRHSLHLERHQTAKLSPCIILIIHSEELCSVLIINSSAEGEMFSYRKRSSTEEDDWRAINTVRVCIQTNGCVLCCEIVWSSVCLCVCVQDLLLWVPWCYAMGSWSLWLGPSQGCVWSWLMCSIPLWPKKKWVPLTGYSLAFLSAPIGKSQGFECLQVFTNMPYLGLIYLWLRSVTFTQL